MASSSSNYNEEEINVESGGYCGSPSRDSGFCSAAVVNVTQKLIAEAVGTFFVVFAGCGSVTVNKMYGQVTFPGICITWGLIVMVMIYSVGHISGAHFNPAVTITFTVFKQFPLKQVPFYITAQLVGSILASGALYLLLSPRAEHFYGTTPVGSPVGELAGIAVGATILLNVFIAGPVSGASMNPARSLGPAIIMHNYTAIWAYILGPIIGTLAGGFTYNLIRFTDKPLREIAKSYSFLRSISTNK